MIGHEHPSVNGYRIFFRAFVQPMRISSHVTIASETGLPIVTTLDHVHSIAGRAKSGGTWQVRTPETT